MTNLLADLALETEAAIALCLRLARAFDNEHDASLRRLMTPAAKFWICKRGPTVAAEAMEVLGGNGYVEESDLPRLYREMPVNSIWEGSGNVMCLDVLRGLAKMPEARDAYLAELALARGTDTRFDRFVAGLERELGVPEEAAGRRLTEKLVLGLQASLLLRHAPQTVADAFCASRLDGDWGRSLGSLPGSVDFRALVERADPS
jgi:putative acyl-CoA dehydrogenase